MYLKSFLKLTIIVLVILHSLSGCADDDFVNIDISSFQPSPFGMDVFLYREMWNDERMQQTAALANEAHVKWSREEFLWEWIEPDKRNFDQEVLTRYDQVIETAIENSIEVFGLISYNAQWSSGIESPSDSQHFEDFADYVSFLVGRYKDKIKYWEIWNEPNVSEFWGPAPNAENYFNILKYAYQAAKDTDPDAKIIGFSVSGIDIEYIGKVLEFGGIDYLDIISIHPYTNPYPLEACYEIELLKDLNMIIASSGKDIPIWVSEVGFPTHNGSNSVSMQRQAMLLVRTYLVLISYGAEMISFYDFKDDGVNPDDFLQNLGIIRNNLEPKESYYAFQYMAYLLQNSRFLSYFYAGENNIAMLFKDYLIDKDILITWTFDEIIDPESTDYIVNQHDITISFSGNINQMTDIFGNTMSENNSYRNPLTIQLTDSPLYIIGNLGELNISQSD